MALRVSKSSPWAGTTGLTGGGRKRGRYAVAAKAERTLDGVVFDSKGEMRRYATLRLMERCGAIKDLKRQVKYDVAINGQHFCSITFDHAYVEKQTDGSWRPVVEEFKSKGTIREKDYALRKKAAVLFYGLSVREIVAG